MKTDNENAIKFNINDCLKKMKDEVRAISSAEDKDHCDHLIDAAFKGNIEAINCFKKKLPDIYTSITRYLPLRVGFYKLIRELQKEKSEVLFQNLTELINKIHREMGREQCYFSETQAMSTLYFLSILTATLNVIDQIHARKFNQESYDNYFKLTKEIASSFPQEGSKMMVKFMFAIALAAGIVSGVIVKTVSNPAQNKPLALALVTSGYCLYTAYSIFTHKTKNEKQILKLSEGLKEPLLKLIL